MPYYCSHHHIVRIFQSVHDILTPYHKTITHGHNYQDPPPDLVDNEEEYEVEKILNSWLFGRCKQLQYLVKWKGYPDLDNMWVNKDDIFADDKVWAFKESDPDARSHVRALQDFKMPHPLSPPSRSSSTSYFIPHILLMSSNGSINDKPCHSAYNESYSPTPGPRSGSPTATKVTAAFRQLSLGPQPIYSAELAEAAEAADIPDPKLAINRDVYHGQMEVQAVGTSTTVTQCEEPGS